MCQSVNLITYHLLTVEETNSFKIHLRGQTSICPLSAAPFPHYKALHNSAPLSFQFLILAKFCVVTLAEGNIFTVFLRQCWLMTTLVLPLVSSRAGEKEGWYKLHFAALYFKWLNFVFQSSLVSSSLSVYLLWVFSVGFYFFQRCATLQWNDTTLLVTSALSTP